MDREKAKKFGKKVLLFLAQVIVITGILLLLNILWNGMPLWGVPSVENMERAELSYPAVTDEVKEASGEELELAVKLTGSLRYDLFQGAEENDEPLITITYFTKDGREIAVSASRKTVWWKGKAHALKEEDMFVKLTEGIFFLDDLVKEKG